MSSEAFDIEFLTEKLPKLNNSQQSIESLSRWCITHRKKARQIVETWEKFFNSSQKEQRVSFLYLANDILQNSRRKGSEYVNEFWKVLPLALKHVYENGGENGKKAVTRLVDIWEERKVFGSRGQGLKDELLGKNPPPPLASNGRSSSSIKIVKRDAHSVRVKLAVGGPPEKILMAFQSVLDESHNEEATLKKCSTAVSHVGKITEELQNTSALGTQHGSALLDEMQEQENVLQQCVGQLESAESARAALILQLKEALQEQESKLEVVRAQLQVIRGQIEQASHLRKLLASSAVPGSSAAPTISGTEATGVVEQNSPAVQPTSTPPLTQPVVSFAPIKPTDDESKKAAAAAVAAKLAASTSSAQMFTSVLSSLVAEEAASKNGGLKSTGFTSVLPVFPPEKRPKLEKPMPVSDAGNMEVGSTVFFSPVQQQPGTSLLVPPSTTMQPVSQPNQIQPSFAAALPPPPPVSPANAPANQFVQSAGMMVGMMPYGYGANPLPPPPPLHPQIAMGLARPPAQPPQQPQAQQQQQQQQQPTAATGGYYRPPGIGFYGQSPQSTPPPVPRQ